MLSIARSFGMIASNNQTVFQFGPDHDKLLALGGGAWVFGISNPVIYMLVLAAITGFVLRWTKFGRHVFAIGGNEHAATLTGIPVRPIKVAVYMFCSFTAGIAGIVETGWLGAVTTNIGAGMELQVIAAAVIGGANLAGGSGTALRRAGRRGADRDHPQQPRPARHQRLLARHLHRRRHPARRAVRPGPQLPPERIDCASTAASYRICRTIG